MENVLYGLKKYGKKSIVVVLVSIFLGYFVYQIIFSESDEYHPFTEVALADSIEVEEEEKKEDVKEEEKNEKKEELQSKIHIDVKGAVKKPGVYEVSSNAIINDVVLMAGGFQTNAYQNSINLSKKVRDEMVLFVYTKDEINTYKEETKKEVTSEPCEVPDYTICDCTNEAKSIIVPEQTETVPIIPSDKEQTQNKPETSQLININTASMEELMMISGIGEAKAKAIVTYRTQNGRFTSIQDILNVSGIGEKLFDKIKDYITV